MAVADGRQKQTKQKQIPSGTWFDWGFWLPVEIKEARSCFRNRSYLVGYLGCPGMKSRGAIGEA